MLGTCKAFGEIGVATALAFQADLYDTIDSSNDALVVLDCSDVTYMDATGYSVLVDATDYAVRHGHTLVIRGLSPSCAVLLRQYDREHELRVET